MSRHFVVNYIPVTGQHFTAHILIFKIFWVKDKNNVNSKLPLAFPCISKAKLDNN